MILGKEHIQKEFEQQHLLDEQLRLLLDTHFESGFILLTIAYMDKLLNYVSSRFKQCDAEEIVQSVLTKAWETLRTYEAGRIRTMRLSAWLYTIAHHQAVNALKHNSLSKEVFSLDTPQGKAYAEDYLQGQSSLLEDEIIHKEDLDDLSLCIAQLPSMYRQVINLYYFAGLSYSEIAQFLNKPLNTVKSDGLRATRLLRYRMQKINEEG